jgi:hypothetical protein
VDFYHEGSLVCWTDSGLEMIQCVSYNGTDTGTKVSMLELSDFVVANVQ